MTPTCNLLLDEKQYTRKGTYNFSSSAKESKGDNVPDVNIIDLTPYLANSSKAIPGLKHHQLSVLDTLPATSK
jgi:hypothetical protein